MVLFPATVLCRSWKTFGLFCLKKKQLSRFQRAKSLPFYGFVLVESNASTEENLKENARSEILMRVHFINQITPFDYCLMEAENGRAENNVQC